MEFMVRVESITATKTGGYTVGLRRVGKPYGWLAVDVVEAPRMSSEYVVTISEAIPGFDSPSDAAHDAAQEGFVVKGVDSGRLWLSGEKMEQRSGEKK